MVSILIPVYNCDVVKLVNDLEFQAMKLGMPFEIVCIDDNSTKHYHNYSLTEKENIVWTELNENKGRSIVRNLLAEKSNYENLIFLDCDMGVVSDHFIEDYIKLSTTEKVIVGGVSYTAKPPVENSKILHWKYGSNRESQSVKERVKHPYTSFMSGNFFVKKEVLNLICFDETIKGYGHEDTLFGIELKNKRVAISHINNSLQHLGLEDANVFLEKSKNAILNLAILIKSGKVDETVKIYRYYKSLKKFFLLPLFTAFYLLNKNRWLENLCSAKPNIRYFDLFKLGLLSEKLSE